MGWTIRHLRSLFKLSLQTYECRRLADWSHQWKILEEVLSLKRRHTPRPQEYKMCTAPKKNVR